MKRLCLYPALFIAVVIAALAFAVDSQSAPRSFKAKLSGKELVPAVRTAASGEATFQLTKDGAGLTYKLTVKDIKNVNGAHIHQGKKGTNGPPVVTLFSGPKKEGKFSGTLAEGTIADTDLAGSLQGKTIKALIQLIMEGNAYVNVHTDAHPDGEIRGQIK